MSNNGKRREREKAEMRLRILDAARELFVSGGEEAVALRRVAERVEYSATTIYLYFPNKEALIRELCAADFAAYCRTFQQAERVTDPILRLQKVASAYVDFGLLHPSHYRAMFMTAASGGESPDGDATSPSSNPAPLHHYDFLHTAVFKAMAAGCFQPQHRDVATIAQVLWSGLHGVLSLHLVRSRYASVTWRPVQAGAEAMIGCLLAGLTTAREGAG